MLTGCLILTVCDAARGVHAVYDEQTRALVRLDYDSDRDGHVDVRTYMDGSRPLRSEVDTNRDGRVDRWEYLDRGARVVMAGGSSRGDGVEDQWAWPEDSTGERRLDRSRTRDGVVSRREFYRGDRLVRAEEDTNADGTSDKWELIENGVIRQVSFDTGFSSGRPDRRLHYDDTGRWLRLEIDPERDGTFVAAR